MPSHTIYSQATGRILSCGFGPSYPTPGNGESLLKDAIGTDAQYVKNNALVSRKEVTFQVVGSVIKGLPPGRVFINSDSVHEVIAHKGGDITLTRSVAAGTYLFSYVPDDIENLEDEQMITVA